MRTSTTYSRATGPAVWSAVQAAALPVRTLTQRQADELRRAATRHPPTLQTFDSVDFPSLLPSLQPLMDDVRTALIDGSGLALLRGVPVGEMTDAQCSVAFWALGTFLGQGVAQSSAGDLIGYVHDAEHPIRSYLNASQMKFHVDLADLVGLMCVRQAKEGGQSLVACSLEIYNEMVDRHPEYLEALSGGFHWSRNGEEAPGEPPFSAPIPVFTVVDGVVSCRFSGSMIRRGTIAHGGSLSPVQIEAIEYIESAAIRLAHASYMRPGDITFMNNYMVLHSRTGFVNGPDPAQARLLLRLWLRTEHVRDFGDAERSMRDEPLIYNRQGRTPAELIRMAQATR